MLQTLLSSPLVAAVATGATFTSTVTVNESGIAHLADSMLACVNNVPGAGESTDLSPHIVITSLEVNGSIILLKGRNTPAGANVFSPHRNANFVGLPTIKVESGDTITLTGIFAQTGAGAADVLFSVPFSPQRFAQRRAPTFARGAAAIVASPATAIAANTAVLLTATIENHGHVDLNNVVLQYALDTTAAIDPSQGSNAAMFASITTFSVRNDYPMIVGQGVPAGVGGYLSILRTRNWIKWGVHEVSPGDTITMTIAADVGAAGVASLTFPQFLSDGSLSQGACAC